STTEAAETAASATTEPSAETTATPSAAERADTARPAAPRSAAPVTATASTSAADAADNEDEDEDHDDRPERNRRALRLASQRSRRAHAVQRDVPPLRDATDEAFGAGQQARAVPSVAEFRRHHLAARLAGKAGGDESLEAVAHFDLHATLFQRQQDQQPVVLALLPDAPSLVLEELDRVFARVGVGLDRRHGDDDHHVAGFFLELANHAIHGGGARRVDDFREVVDW